MEAPDTFRLLPISPPTQDGACKCLNGACGRNVACVMLGPKGGVRAVFWHPTAWQTTTGDVRCIGIRAPWHCNWPPRPWSRTCLSCDQQMVEQPRKWQWSSNQGVAQCKMATYSCPQGCDEASAQRWKEFMENHDREVTPELVHREFGTCKYGSRLGCNVNNKYHKIPDWLQAYCAHVREKYGPPRPLVVGP